MDKGCNDEAPEDGQLSEGNLALEWHVSLYVVIGIYWYIELTLIVPIMRKAMRPFAFSDGTVIPSGTHVVVAALPMHLDEEYFTDASQFQPFRFAELRKDDGEDHKYLFASISPSYVSFGCGTHAWYAESALSQSSLTIFASPGRFFASSVMKAMMAYLVINYDIKLEKEGERPPDEWFMMIYECRSASG